MNKTQRRHAVRAVNLKINALRNAKSKLRMRRDTVASLTSDQLLRIELELVRLQWKINELRDLKAAWKLGEKSLQAPSTAVLEEMKEQVAAIAAINARNQNARQIISAATVIAGALRNPGMDG